MSLKSSFTVVRNRVSSVLIQSLVILVTPNFTYINNFPTVSNIN